MVISGGSKGGHEGRAPPGGPNSFNFMQLFGKFGKIVCWRLPWGVGAPSSEKSWIRHWLWLLTEKRGVVDAHRMLRRSVVDAHRMLRRGVQ